MKGSFFFFSPIFCDVSAMIPFWCKGTAQHGKIINAASASPFLLRLLTTDWQQRRTDSQQNPGLMICLFTHLSSSFHINLSSVCSIQANECFTVGAGNWITRSVSEASFSQTLLCCVENLMLVVDLQRHQLIIWQSYRGLVGNLECCEVWEILLG